MSTEIKVSGGLVFPEGVPTRAGEVVNSIDEIYDIPAPRVGMIVYDRSTGLNYIVRSLKAKVIDGVQVDNAQVDKYEELLERQITWNANSHINTITAAGVYNITGERTNSKDGLPMLNAASGHTIHARLEVLDSSIAPEGKSDDICITQKLTLSNRVAGDGDVYIRTGRGTSKEAIQWETWGKLQQNIEVGEVTTLDNLIDNGIYSGIWTNGSFINISYPTTFVCVVINDYFLKKNNSSYKRKISQFVYGITAIDGTTEFKYRIKEGDEDWSNWEILNKKDIDSMITNAVKDATEAFNSRIDSLIDGAPDTLDTLQEIAEWVKSHEDLYAILKNIADQNTVKINNEVDRAKQAENVIKSKATHVGTLHFTADANNVRLGGKAIDGNATIGENIPSATTTSSGVMSAADKVALDKAVEDIANEIERSGNADVELFSMINDEQRRAENAEQVNSNAITAERTRAMGQEGLLNNAIITEKERAENQLADEVTRAKAAETALDNKISNEVEKLKDGNTIVGQAREIHSRNGKTVTDSFLARTTAGSGTIGDGVATLKSVGGNIVKNLLGQINSIAINVKYDISLANANVAITAKDNYIGDSASSTYIGIKTGKYFSGHKYYIAANCYSDIERNISVAMGYNGYGGKMFYFPTIGAGKWTYISKLVELNIENPVPYFSIFPFGHVDEYIQAGVLVFAGGINIINLTEMFGESRANRMTVAECDKIFATMDALSQGLSIANPTTFKSTGFNQFNPDMVLEDKAIKTTDDEGNAIPPTIGDGDKTLAIIPCLPCKIGEGENNGYCIHGDFDEGAEKVYFTPLNPLDVESELYMHELTKDADRGTYVPQIKGYMLVEVPMTANLCVHFLWSEDCDRNAYEPYYESKVELPIIPEMGEYGLAGIAASGVLDTIDLENNKFTKRVGCVDLGSLTWEKMTAIRFRTTGLDMKRVTNKIQLVCDKYTVLPTIYYKDTYANNTALKDVIFPVYFDNDINIMTSVEYASDADFKAAVSGVKLYYELSAYEEYPLPKVANNYTSSDYGVEQFNSVVPCNANNLYYMRSLAGETRNFLDRLMAGLETDDATAVADRILAVVNPVVEPVIEEEIEP